LFSFFSFFAKDICDDTNSWISPPPAHAHSLAQHVYTVGWPRLNIPVTGQAFYAGMHATGFVNRHDVSGAGSRRGSRSGYRFESCSSLDNVACRRRQSSSCFVDHDRDGARTASDICLGLRVIYSSPYKSCEKTNT
jgi:hypothetical protein